MNRQINPRFLVAASLLPVLVVLPTMIFTATVDAQEHQSWQQYDEQTCDPVNDPSSCKPS
jgi:hypothetical protein